jgi:hypothetical protein
MFDRPRLIAALLLVALLAGCTWSGGLRMSAVNDTQLATNASHSVEDAKLQAPNTRLLRETIETGNASRVAPEQPLFEPLQERPVRYRDRYYDLTWTADGSRPGASVRVRVNYTDTASVPPDRRITYENLPGPDKDALAPFLPTAESRSELWRSGDSLTSNTTYTAEELNQSVLVGDQQYDAVVYEGTTYPVDSLGVERTTVTTYRYRATVVAEDTEAYADRVKTRYAFTLDGLNESERTVVTTAIDDSYTAASEEDSAFESVASRFESHRAVERDAISGEWVVRYRGRLYWATLRFGSLPLGNVA